MGQDVSACKAVLVVNVGRSAGINSGYSGGRHGNQTWVLSCGSTQVEFRKLCSQADT